MRFRRLLILLTFFSVFVLTLLPAKSTAGENTIVYVVPIEETVEKGLAAFLERAIDTAEKEGAEAIIFEINTPGGVVTAANDIAKLFDSTDIKTISFVNKQALSAGAYIALNTDEIYMTPGSTMGAAGIITQDGNAADKKSQSYWLSAMKGAAEQHGRDPIYAMAMADEDIHLPQYGAEKGKFLTLTAQQAVEVGYSEGTVKSLDQLLEKLGLADAEVRHLETSFAEELARFFTNPAVVTILLSIAGLGLILELYSPGFGVPGFMGLTALVLFFYGHLVAGLAGYESIVLFVVGIVLIILEFFVPGGIVGILGLLAITGSLFLATDNIVHMGVSILTSIGIAIATSIIMAKVLGKRMKIFRKIVLRDSTSTESGYVSNKNRTELIGLEGIAITPLRPSGTVLIEDERIDVVSEGSFIQKDKKVKIIKVEGSRIVVREIPDLNNN